MLAACFKSVNYEQYKDNQAANSDFNRMNPCEITVRIHCIQVK